MYRDEPVHRLRTESSRLSLDKKPNTKKFKNPRYPTTSYNKGVYCVFLPAGFVAKVPFGHYFCNKHPTFATQNRLFQQTKSGAFDLFFIKRTKVQSK